MTAQTMILGLDVGTSGVKAILVSDAGDVRAAATTPLTLSTPHPGWAEQDPEAWWAASIASIKDVLQQCPDARVAAIGLSGQMHSSVFLDRTGDVVRPALLWCDGRTTAECREIAALAGGEAMLRDWVMNPALEGFTLPKLLWLRHHEPAAWSRVATVLLPKDFVRFRLTGVLSTEPSDASGTLVFDPAAHRWSEPMLQAVQVSAALLPEVAPSTAVHGVVSASSAALLGLAAGTPVVGGGADNACGALGVGCVSPGDAVVSWGTSGTVVAPTAQPLVDTAMRAHTFCHVVPHMWYLMGVVLSAGAAVRWYQDQYARELDGTTAMQALDQEAAAIERGAGDLVFLPYLQGERTPHRDATARGALLGLSLAHTRAHMTRAVLEGVCFALNDSMSILRDLGIAPNDILATGGGARSPLVRQLLAEIVGLPIDTVNREEGPAYGAALLAAVGVGVYPDVIVAASKTLTRSRSHTPSVDAIAAYRAPYDRFRRAYLASGL